MKAQFNLINLPNQSIKLNVNILDRVLKKKVYLIILIKNVIFKYSININKSQLALNIYLRGLIRVSFIKTFWDHLFMIFLLNIQPQMYL